jgi:hypothetical protein
MEGAKTSSLVFRERPVERCQNRTLSKNGLWEVPRRVSGAPSFPPASTETESLRTSSIWQVEGRLLFEKHVKQSRQFNLILRSTCIARSVVGELCKFVSQEALGRLPRKVHCVPRRGQLPTLVVSAPQ